MLVAIYIHTQTRIYIYIYIHVRIWYITLRLPTLFQKAPTKSSERDPAAMLVACSEEFSVAVVAEEGFILTVYDLESGAVRVRMREAHGGIIYIYVYMYVGIYIYIHIHIHIYIYIYI